ncbi:hypothetical protein TDB9533_00202 [Thalassocella blandensis]|nr:hypothetical protein TDB9533_00202 [Thalassocella blandensis]
MKIREQLQQAFSNDSQRVITYSGMLSRQEMASLRLQGNASILLQAEQAGRITVAKESYTVWRTWLSRRFMDMQYFINKFYSQGDDHGS